MDINSMLNNTAKELLKLGIPVSDKIDQAVRVNSRAKKRLGCCIERDGRFTIEVSSAIVDDAELLKRTLIHELLHTCPGCRNHGKIWKSYASAASEATGAKISRTVKLEETGMGGEPNPKYILLCESCGKRIARERLSRVVKYPWRYRCVCGGRIRREK